MKTSEIELSINIENSVKNKLTIRKYYRIELRNWIYMIENA